MLSPFFHSSERSKIVLDSIFDTSSILGTWISDPRGHCFCWFANLILCLFIFFNILCVWSDITWHFVEIL